MKPLSKLLMIVLLAGFLSCQDEGPQMGCLTGIHKTGNGERTFIRCCTHDQYLAGDNVAQGGTSNIGNYNDVQWEAVDDCSDCN